VKVNNEATIEGAGADDAIEWTQVTRAIEGQADDVTEAGEVREN